MSLTFLNADNKLVSVSADNPLPTSSGGGGSGPSEVEVTNFPATQAVSGTVTVTSLATAGATQQGAVADAAYTDVTGAANGTMIALLKGIFVQLAEINAKTPEV